MKGADRRLINWRFHRSKITQSRGFIALRLIPAGASRAAVGRPDRPFIRLQTALRLRPRRALSSAEAKRVSMPTGRSRKQMPSVT